MTKRILIIDDEEHIRRMMRITLEAVRPFFHVVTAATQKLEDDRNRITYFVDDA